MSVSGCALSATAALPELEKGLDQPLKDGQEHSARVKLSDRLMVDKLEDKQSGHVTDIKVVFLPAESFK